MEELINPKFEDMNKKFSSLCSSLQKQVDSLLSKYEDSTEKMSESILNNHKDIALLEQFTKRT